jgi:hypothetical protein
VGRWYPLEDLLAASPGVTGGGGDAGNITVVGPARQEAAAPLEAAPPLHVRGGGVVPLQRHAPTTRAARRTPATLALALQRPAPERGSGAARRAWDEGVPPYCSGRVTARRLPGGALAACGIWYLDDGESPEVTGPGSVLIWYTSVASSDGSSGDLTAEAARPTPAAAAAAAAARAATGISGKPAPTGAAPRDAAEGLTYEAVVIAGLPPLTGDGNQDGTDDDSSDGDTEEGNDGGGGEGDPGGGGDEAAGAAPEGDGEDGGDGGAAATNATAAAAPAGGAAQQPDAAGATYSVAIGNATGPLAPVDPQSVNWDAGRGVLRISGLQLPVGAGFRLTWQPAMPPPGAAPPAVAPSAAPPSAAPPSPALPSAAPPSAAGPRRAAPAMA